MISSALVLLTGGSACNRSPDSIGKRHMEAAKKRQKANQPAAAVLELRSAVQAMPQNPEAHYQLGLALLEAGQTADAVASLRKATEIDPRHPNAALKLAQLMVSSTQKEVLDDAVKRLEQIQEVGSFEPEVLLSLAAADWKLGRVEESEARVLKAYEKFPHDPEISSAYAQLLARQGKEDQAEHVLLEATRKPGARTSYWALARFYLSKARFAQARHTLRQLVDLDPHHTGAWMELAALENREGRPERAAQIYRQLADSPQSNLRAVYALFQLKIGKRDEAVTAFRALVAANPGDRASRSGLIASLLQSQRIQEAETILDSALQRDPRDSDALLQRAATRLSAGHVDEAAADLDQLRQHNLGRPEVHFLAARLHHARGQSQVEKAELVRALERNAAYLPARVDLAKLLIKSGNAKQAVDLIDAAPGDQRLAPSLSDQRTWAYFALGRKEEARKAVATGLSISRSPELLLQKALLEIDSGQLTPARELLHEVLAQRPEDTRALDLLRRSYGPDRKSALTAVRAHAAKNTTSVLVQYYLGTALLSSGDRDGARQVYHTLLDKKPHFGPARMALAGLDLAENKTSSAYASLSSLLDRDPGNLTARQWLAQIELRNGREAAAVDQYYKIVQAHPQDKVANNNLAALLLDQGKVSEAIRFAQKAKEAAPADAAVDDTLGWAFYHAGLYSAALRHLNAAVSAEPTAKRKLHLAMACLRTGNPSRARTLIEEARRVDPGSRELQEALAFQTSMDGSSGR